MFKKIISLVLCAAIICGCGISLVSANEAVPTIIIPGYASCSLFYNYGEENQEKIWGLQADKMLAQAGSNLPAISLAILKTIMGNSYALGWDIGNQGVLMLEKIRCEDNGSSAYPINTYPNVPELCSYRYLSEETDGSELYEKEFAAQVAGKIGGDNVFIFHVDHRLSAVDTVEKLKTFIEDVKEYTKSEKVNLFGLSHGGMLVGVYLSMFGTQGSINNAVMSVPALGGTDIAVNVLQADSKLAFADLMKFLETAVSAENTDFARFLESVDTEGLDGIAQGFFEGFHDIMLNWGSLWDFIPADDYEAMKAEYLDGEKNEELIRKADLMHYEIMPNYTENFNKCIESGVDVSILCSTGNGIALGSDTNADIIIHAASESGAKCAPLGQRFADGYQCIGTVCSNPAHNHLSPSMEVDASCAYLPENTWFIDGQFHGMYYFEDYSNALVNKLLLTDEIENIYSDSAYPQFEVSQHTYTNVYAKFNVSSSGYVTGEDSALIIKNVSKENNIDILSVICDGLDISFSSSDLATLAPGESISVPFDGEIPSVSVKRAAVTVNYFESGSLPALNTRTFDITIMNGERAAYSAATPYDDSDYISSLEDFLPDGIYNLIVRLGLRKSLQVIFDTLSMYITMK